MGLRDMIKKRGKESKNFKYLDDLIHSGANEIVLDSDIILSSDEKKKYSDGIRLDLDDIIIDGKGHSIDGSRNARIFHSTARNIVVKNLTFKRGFHEAGGAIKNENDGVLRVENCSFHNNNATITAGAIFNFGKITIDNTKFSKNTAKYGAAINNQRDCEATLNDCDFTENSSKEDAGAIANWGNIRLDNVRFIKNTAKNIGGAIRTDAGSDMTLTNCDFTGNTSGDAGGAIVNLGKLCIDNVDFTKNTSKGPGGALNNQKNCEIIITDSNFSDNNSNEAGGGIFNYGKISMDKVDFNTNTAKKGSGGSLNNQRSGDINIMNCSFMENDAKGVGGAISNWGRIRIDYVDFTKNNAQKLSGGAFYNDERGNATLINCNFFENSAYKMGGAIGNEGMITIKNGNFAKNRTRVSPGGALCNEQIGEATLRNCHFHENNKGHKEVLSNSGNLKIFNCEISNNDTWFCMILNVGFLQAYNTCFKDNRSKYMIVNGKMSTAYIVDGNFSTNRTYGSVIINKGKSCVFEKCIFKSNRLVGRAKNIINITELTLIKLIIDNEGKTILNEGHILLKDEIYDISPKIEGNGKIKRPITSFDEERFDFGYLDRLIHENQGDELVLDEDICFEDYEIPFYEGGIELDMDGLVIDGNGHIIDGGGKTRIFTINGNDIILKNITFKNGYSHKNFDNLRNSDGGAIATIRNIKLNIQNCKFINNTSEVNSGAISNQGELTIARCSFSKNTSQGFGGAINNWDRLTLLQSTFTDNLCQKNGGAVCNLGDSEIFESIFEANASKGGGAILNGPRLTIKDSYFNKNKAPEGGAITNIGELSISESEFNENTSPDGIGGALANAGEMEISKSAFNDNISKDHSHDIFNDGRLKLTQIQFKSTKKTILNKDNIMLPDRKASSNIRNKGTIHYSILDEDTRNFTYLEQLIKSDENVILLNHDILLDMSNSEDKKYSEGIVIDKDNLTIDGNGHVIDACRLARIFNCKGKNIEIKNVTLKNGFAKTVGGAIHNSGKLKISKSNITRNKSQKNGGAINSTGELTVTESTISKNFAKENGGAITNDCGKINISDSTISNNEAKMGAIVSTGTLFIYNSMITKNRSLPGSATVCAFKHEFNNCTIKSNKPNQLSWIPQNFLN